MKKASATKISGAVHVGERGYIPPVIVEVEIFVSIFKLPFHYRPFLSDLLLPPVDKIRIREILYVLEYGIKDSTPMRPILSGEGYQKE